MGGAAPLFGDAVTDAASAAADAVPPASAAVRLRAVGLLCRSRAATRSLAGAVRIIFECLFGASTTARLRAEGLRFATLVLQLADPPALAPVAPLLLKVCNGGKLCASLSSRCVIGGEVCGSGRSWGPSSR